MRGEDAALTFRFAVREIEHLGSAHDEAEREALKAAARQRIAAGQLELDLGLEPAGGGPLPITSSRMAQRAAPEGVAVALGAHSGSPTALIATSAKSLSARIGVAPYLPARYLRPIASSMRGLRSESAYSLLAPS